MHDNILNNNYTLSYEYLLDLRLKAAIQRYEGMEEYMDIPDMNIWINLKNELICKLYKCLYYEESVWSDLEYDDSDYVSDYEYNSYEYTDND
jgi:hypothetical protein